MIGKPANNLKRDAGHLMVCHAARREDWIADSIFDIVAGNQIEWTPKEWKAVLKDLDANTLTIREWIF